LAQCTACGAQLPSGSVYCRNCGSSVYPQQPAYVYSDPLKRSDSVMSTGAFLGTILLMGIPLVGFILTIVWACGGTQNLNRRNLARACLILTAIGLVIYGIVVALFIKGIMNLPTDYLWDMASRRMVL